MYDLAKKELPDSDLYVGDILNIPDEINDNYDVIICLGVIEHYREPNAFLNQFNILLKKGGTLILSFAQSSILARITSYKCRRQGVPAYVHKRKKIHNTLKSLGFVQLHDINLGLSQRMMIFEKI